MADVPDPVTGSLLQTIKLGIRAVPAVRYAMGVAAIGAAVALVAGVVRDYRVAVFGVLLMFILMVVLVVFSSLAKTASKELRPLALMLAYAFVILTIAAAGLLFTSFFFRWPLELASENLSRPVTAQTISPTPILADEAPKADIASSSTQRNVQTRSNLIVSTVDNKKVTLRNFVMKRGPSGKETRVVMEVIVDGPIDGVELIERQYRINRAVGDGGASTPSLANYTVDGAIATVDGKTYASSFRTGLHFIFRRLPCDKEVTFIYFVRGFSSSAQIKQKRYIRCSNSQGAGSLVRVPTSGGKNDASALVDELVSIAARLNGFAPRRRKLRPIVKMPPTKFVCLRRSPWPEEW